jgi:hypothetical protein
MFSDEIRAFIPRATIFDGVRDIDDVVLSVQS